MRHRKRALLIVVVAAWLTMPASLGAWGFAAHRFIIEQAIARLPGELRPFYQKHETFLVDYSVLPDLLRNLDVAGEPPRHFLDLDAYGAYPFEALPRDYDAAVRKFGLETVEKNGTLPWRADEIYGRLVQAFERAGRREAYSLDDIKLMSAVLAHYVADAHVPFHAVVNYDGQLTNQRGIHARFESELFERSRSRLHVRPEAIPPVRDMRTFIFEALLKSSTLTAPILEADRRAAAGRAEYDDLYFERWAKEAEPVVEQRVSDAIAATVAAFTGAWVQAGRPDVPLELPHRVRKVGGASR